VVGWCWVGWRGLGWLAGVGLVEVGGGWLTGLGWVDGLLGWLVVGWGWVVGFVLLVSRFGSVYGC
jgi:hypothetical protein